MIAQGLVLLDSFATPLWSLAGGAWIKREWDKKSLASQLSLDCRVRRSGCAYYADFFISFYSPYQLCGGRRNRIPNELPISVSLSYFYKSSKASFTHQEAFFFWLTLITSASANARRALDLLCHHINSYILISSSRASTQACAPYREAEFSYLSASGWPSQYRREPLEHGPYPQV